MKKEHNTVSIEITELPVPQGGNKSVSNSYFRCLFSILLNYPHHNNEIKNIRSKLHEERAFMCSSSCDNIFNP